MTTCANCENEAFLAYRVTAEYTIPFCSKHLPRFLSGATKDSARLVRIEAIAPKASKKKTVEEEPVIEEAPVSEPEPEILDEVIEGE